PPTTQSGTSPVSRTIRLAMGIAAFPRDFLGSIACAPPACPLAGPVDARLDLVARSMADGLAARTRRSGSFCPGDILHCRGRRSGRRANAHEPSPRLPDHAARRCGLELRWRPLGVSPDG